MFFLSIANPEREGSPLQARGREAPER